MTFQMRDDYLDLTFGDKTKSAFSDIQEGQQTYFTHYIFSTGTPEQQDLLRSCMGKNLSQKEITNLQEMFEASGALDFGKEKVLEYSQQARAILEKIDFTQEAKTSILSLIKKIEKLEH